MEATEITASIAVLAFLLSLGALVFKGGWGIGGKFSKMAEAQSAALTAMESRLAQTVAESARDLEFRIENSTKLFGETILGIRQQMANNEKEVLEEMHILSDKVRQVEIWARDELVNKESFDAVCTRIENTVAQQGRDVNSAVQSVRDAIIALATKPGNYKQAKIDSRS
jgi:hypothetical protein